MENIIIIRAVMKITKCHMEPAKDPKTNRFGPTVREVDSKGDMILSDEDKRSNNFFIKANDVIDIYDGKEFNLSDPVDFAWWEAIKHSASIAKDRAEKDALGNLTIDGNGLRYGNATFYIEHPGLETKQRVNRKQTIHTAEGFVWGDSPEGLYQKVRILGHEMKGMPLSDVQDYLIIIASKDPEKVIDLYTGGDTQLRLFLLDASDKNIIVSRNSLYYYGETILGSSETAVINWFKQPTNKIIFDTIKAETYPELIVATYQKPVYKQEVEETGETAKPVNKSKK